MKRFIVAIVSFCFIFSCNRSENNQYLSSDSMKVIIWEMTCADELTKTLHQQNNQSSEAQITRDTLYQKIFALHKITSKHFFDSYQYYSNKPTIFKAIIDSSLTYGQRQRSLVNQHLKETIPIATPQNEQARDSVKKIKLKLKPFKIEEDKQHQ